MSLSSGPHWQTGQTVYTKKKRVKTQTLTKKRNPARKMEELQRAGVREEVHRTKRSQSGFSCRAVIVSGLRTNPMHLRLCAAERICVCEYVRECGS